MEQTYFVEVRARVGGEGLECTGVLFDLLLSRKDFFDRRTILP